MKRYLVKETSTATEQNLNFAGKTCTSWVGKNQQLIRHEAPVGYDLASFDRTCYMAKDYGYKRRCDAMRSWVYKNPENTKYWHSTVEIVEVEI